MSTKDERRASSGAMLRNYRDAYTKDYGEPCCITDNELFDLVDDAPVLSTSEEQDQYILDMMHDFELCTIRARNNAPQDQTFPGKRGDQVLNAVDHIYGEKTGAVTMRDIYNIVIEKLERCNITIQGQEIDQVAIGQMVCVEIERKLGIFPNIVPATYETET